MFINLIGLHSETENIITNKKDLICKTNEKKRVLYPRLGSKNTQYDFLLEKKWLFNGIISIGLELI